MYSLKELSALIPPELYRRLLRLIIFQVSGMTAGFFIGRLITRLSKKKAFFFGLLNGVFWANTVRIFWQENLIFTFTVLLMGSVTLCILFQGVKGHSADKNLLTVLLVLSAVSIFFDPDKTLDLVFHLLGGLAGAFLLLSITLFSAKIKSKEDFDLSTVFFGGIIALTLGWEKFLCCFFLAAMTAAVFLALRKIKHQEETKVFRFEPYLAFGFLITVLFGTKIIDYLIDCII